MKQARTKVFLDARVVVLVGRLVAVGATVRDAVRLAAVPGAPCSNDRVSRCK